MGPIDLVHGGRAGVGSALCPNVGVVVVVVVVMGVVPGLRAALVQVAVQRAGRIGIGGGSECQLTVGSSCQGAAQAGWDRGGLVRAVPEGRREDALAHWEGTIWVKEVGKKVSNEHASQALVSFPEGSVPPYSTQTSTFIPFIPRKTGKHKNLLQTSTDATPTHLTYGLSMKLQLYLPAFSYYVDGQKVVT